MKSNQSDHSEQSGKTSASSDRFWSCSILFILNLGNTLGFETWGEGRVLLRWVGVSRKLAQLSWYSQRRRAKTKQETDWGDPLFRRHNHVYLRKYTAQRKLLRLFGQNVYLSTEECAPIDSSWEFSQCIHCIADEVINPFFCVIEHDDKYCQRLPPSLIKMQNTFFQRKKEKSKVRSWELGSFYVEHDGPSMIANIVRDWQLPLYTFIQNKAILRNRA